MSSIEAYANFAASCRTSVDEALSSWLAPRVAAAVALGEHTGSVAKAMEALALRGGKRVRAVLLSAAYEGIGGEGGYSRVMLASVALELLQVYLLIHDDWMDGDDMRRGGPSVHRMLAERFGSVRSGEVTAILAGDLACSMAQEALLGVPVEASRLLAATRRFARIQEQVVLGQLMDMSGAEPLEGTLMGAIETMYAHKTGSYTAQGPLAMGALLAGGPPSVVGALEDFGVPLGVAFQLRDDLLGTFGDPRETGKPRFGDLRQGKRTALVAELLSDGARREAARGVFGNPAAGEDELGRLASLLVESGARARVEARLEELLSQARARLGSIELTPEGRRVLEGALQALGERTS